MTQQQDTKQELESVAHLGDVIAEGESKRGGYNAYNSGTSNGRVVHSGVKDLSKMTVDQILASSERSAQDRDRVFAAGKYQVITDRRTGTLRAAKAALGLTGQELFTPELQERIFLHFLLGKKRPKIGAYITRGEGTSEDAVYVAAMEWASIEVPAGRRVGKQAGSYVSDGRKSYYEGTANHAKPQSGARVKAALEQARAAYAAAKTGDTTDATPEPLETTVGDGATTTTAPDATTTPAPDATTTAPTQDGGGTVTVEVGPMIPIKPGHLIAGSVGRGGRNHEGDVGAVQQALASHGHAPGAIDHAIGPRTIAAIEAFQRGFLPRPDGLVEVGRATERHLMTPTSPDAPQPTTTTPDLAPQVAPVAPTTSQPTSVEPATPQPAPVVADSAPLKELMARPRLTVDELGQARALIAREPATTRGALYRELQTKVMYANQRDNEARDRRGNQIETGSGEMCNLTSLAMCLQYLGIPNPHPEMQYEDALEKVRQDKGLPARTYATGWGGVARALGAKVDMLAGAGRHARAWWTSAVGEVLASGKSVMVSITGHIIRIQAVTAEGVVVDDPYGRHKLLAGVAKKVEAYNKKDATGNAGEDNLLPWAQVEPHTFAWVASFSK